MSRLTLALQNSSQYPEPIRDELNQLIATLQAWANISGDTQIPGNLKVGGLETIDGQHCIRLIASSGAVLNATESALTLTAPSAQPVDNETYQVGVVGPADSIVFLSEPGLYLIFGSIQWDLNGAGTYRMSQLRVIGITETGIDRRAPSAAYAVTNQSFYALRVTPELLATIDNRLVSVSLEAVQDSGGTRTVSGILSITKVA